jgi:hypothetical protein
MYGGINKLKHHLARVVCKNAIVFYGCLAEVTVEMEVSLQVIKDRNTKRARTKFEVGGMGRSQMTPPISFSSNARPSPSISSPFSLPCTDPRSQPNLDGYNKNKRKEGDMEVRRFWYHDRLSFNLAKTSCYQPMVDVLMLR